MVILKLAVPVLPCASVALHVTVVCPTGKVAPDAGEQVGVIAPSRLSVAVAEKVTTLPVLTVVVWLMSAGAWTTGGVVSTRVMVILKLAVPVLPCASVALHVTVVCPTGKVAPDA